MSRLIYINSGPNRLYSLINSHALTLIAGIILSMPHVLPAQESIITDRPSAIRPRLPDYVPDDKSPGFTLPLAPKANPKVTIEKGPVISVTEFRFSGNSVFTDEELQIIAAPFIHDDISAADLEELRHRLTQHYIQAGYINSGAIIPKQHYQEGIVEFKIVEGQLTEIQVHGNERLNSDYVRDRLLLGAGTPLHDETLQNRFQLLLTDPLIERMDGRLKPGLTPGTSLLEVDVDRAKPYQLRLSTDNYRPPSTGAEQINLGGWVRNLSGFGEIVDLTVGYSEGAFNIDTGFAVPINKYDTSLAFRYARTRSSIIEQPLVDINIDNVFRKFEISLTHPIYKTLKRQLFLGTRFELRKSRNTLLGRPFSFSSGEEHGISKISVLRFYQEFVDSQMNQVFSFRSTFSIGLNAFDATWHNDDRPDGDFFAWLGQLQYARQIMDNGAQIRFRGDLQASDDLLLPLERFAVGGIYSVRGYRENELVRDQGYALALELHYPLLKSNFDLSFPGSLILVPFMDYGAAWNKGDSNEIHYLHSIGVGLLWTPHWRINAELFYAHDLNQAVEKPDYDLQDAGLHFRISTVLF